MLTQLTLSNQKALAITHDLIPHIKSILAVLFPVAQATTRLEIFARISGHKTWASLKDRLKSSEEPVLLYQTPTLSPDKFWEKLNLETKQHLHTYQNVGVLNLVFSGLNKSFSREFGWVGLPETTQYSDILSYAREIPVYSPFSQEPQGPTLILLSPQNIQDAQTAGLVKETEVNPTHWMCIFVSKTSPDGFFDLENIEYSNTQTAEFLEKTLLKTSAQKTFFYSKEDEQIWSEQTSSKHLFHITHVRHAYSILDRNDYSKTRPFDLTINEHCRPDERNKLSLEEISLDFFGLANAIHSYTPDLLTTQESKRAWRNRPKTS